MTEFALRVVTALLAGYGVLMLLLFAVALVRALKWRRESLALAARLPEVREFLVYYLAGSNDLTRLRGLVSGNRGLLAAGIMSFQSTVAGSALERLGALAMQFALLHEWMDDSRSRDPLRRRAAYAGLAFVGASATCRPAVGDLLVLALKNPDPDIRLSAARGAAQSGSGREVEGLFEFALSQNLLVRILLAEGLRRHAFFLCERAVPAVLKSSDPERVLAALEILMSWECAIPFSDVAGLIEHPDRRIRIQALKLVPVVPQDPKNRSAVLRALGDADAEIGAAAALSAGKMKMTEALSDLAKLVRTASRDLARSAAAALASMPPRGWSTLEELSANASPVAAALAGEALARARREAGA